MPIDETSPIWAVLADWVRIILTLPDPPPDALRQVNDLVVLTAISGLSQRLSPELGNELRKAVSRLKGCPGCVRTALQFGSQSTLGVKVLLTADG